MSKVVDLVFLKNFWNRIKDTFIRTPKVEGKPGQVLTVSDDGLKWKAPEVTIQQPSDWNSTKNPTQILNKPDLKTVATTGDYNDLINKPEIPDITPLATKKELENYLPLIGGHITGNVTVDTILEANTIKKTGGTSNLFLKADGSVDSTVYTDKETFEKFVDSVPKEDGKLIYSDSGVFNAKQLLYTEGLIVDNDADLEKCKAGTKTDMKQVFSEWQRLSFSGYDNKYGSVAKPEITSSNIDGIGVYTWSVDDAGNISNPTNSIDVNGFVSNANLYNYIDACALSVTKGDSANDLFGIWPAVVEDTSEQCLYVLELYAVNLNKNGRNHTVGLSINKIPCKDKWFIYHNSNTNWNSLGIGSMQWVTKYLTYYANDAFTAGEIQYYYDDQTQATFPKTVYVGNNEIQNFSLTDSYSVNSALQKTPIGASFTLIGADTGLQIVPYDTSLNQIEKGVSLIVKTYKRRKLVGEKYHSIFRFEFTSPFSISESATNKYNNGVGLESNYIELDTGDSSGIGAKITYNGIEQNINNTDVQSWLGKMSEEVKRGYWSMSTPNVTIESLEYNTNLLILADHKNTVYEYENGGWIDTKISPESLFTGSRLAYNELTKKLFYSDGAAITNLSELISEVYESANNKIADTNAKVSGLEARVENITSGQLPNQIYQHNSAITSGSTVTISNDSRYLTISVSSNFTLECTQPNMSDPTSSTTVLVQNVGEGIVNITLPTNVKNLYDSTNVEINAGKFAEITFTFWNDSWITMNVFTEK